MRVGLTGGYASGKSTVGRVFERLGCLLVRADDLGHQTLAPDGEAYGPVIAEFGREVLHEDGTIDRRRLGAIVFHDPARLAALNALVHPAVFRREQERIEAYESEHPGGIAVVEAAIMIEAGSWRRYEKLVVAVCSLEQQIARAMARDGLSREEVRARIDRQMPLAEKVKFADWVVDTSGTIEETERRAESVYDELRRLPSRLHPLKKEP